MTERSQPNSEPAAWRWRFQDQEKWYVQKVKPSHANDSDVVCEALYPASAADHDTLVKTLQKIRSYNVDIAAGRINYRPHDHIQVIDEALAAVEAKP